MSGRNAPVKSKRRRVGFNASLKLRGESAKTRKKRAARFRKDVGKTIIELIENIQQRSSPNLSSSQSSVFQFLTEMNLCKYINEVAFWKSKAMSLEAENKTLRNMVESLLKLDKSENEAVAAMDHNNSPSNLDESDSENDSDIEFGVDENLLKFLEKSAKFRLERDRAKKNQSIAENVSLIEAPPAISEKAVRIKELELLYGKDHSSILGLETSTELNFDRFVSSHNPILWPVIQIRY